jgi:GntR family transcriptional regulator, transcriptional repressor for pyruvate dehydrogenase complex
VSAHQDGLRTDSSKVSARVQLHQPRLAEMVADVLRQRIVTGVLQDGDLLPRQEDLLEEFAVSRPPLREALRILESEGLITVRRGNRGGAVIHAPHAHNAGYSIGLVLKAQRVSLTDVGAALSYLEPLCASLCAAREDRATTVIPRLRAVHEAAVASIDDELEFTRVQRQFHEELVEVCGNETLKLVVGALESLWSRQEQAWAEQVASEGGFPARENRLEGLRAHERLLQLIEEGQAIEVSTAATRHLAAIQRYALSVEDREKLIA